MKIRYLLIVPVILASGLLVAAEERTLTLVTSVESTFSSLSNKEIRRLYLGEPLLKDGKPVRPLRNSGEPYLEEVFLQKIIFLSSRAYEYQILARVFRFGGQRPESFDNQSRLVEALRANPNAVSFMWADEAAHQSGLKNIGELWTGNIE